MKTRILGSLGKKPRPKFFWVEHTSKLLDNGVLNMNLDITLHILWDYIA